MGQGAEPLKQVPVALEIGPQHVGDGQDIVAVGYRGHHLVHDKAGGGLDIFLVAGGAEPTAFAREGQQILMLARVVVETVGEKGRALVEKMMPLSARAGTSTP